MYISFSRISGPYELDDRMPTKASTVLAVGDALKEDTGLGPATSDAEIVALALQDRVSVANQTPIQTLIILDRAKFYGVAEAGTFVSTSDANIACDLNSADGLAADTSSNKDWIVMYVLSTTQAVGKFTHLASAQR